MDIFSIFFNMRVCSVFSLESPLEAILMSTHNIPFSISQKKIILNYPKSAAMGFCPRNSKRSSK